MIKQAIRQFLGSDRKQNLFADMAPEQTYEGTASNPVFITGPGRSGTHLMAKLFEALPGVAAYHLDDVGDSIGDSFEIYRKWNGFPISNVGFLNSRGFLIRQAQQQALQFVESNPLIAFSIQDLIGKFGGVAVIMVRHPKKVVESHYKKGWYKKVPAGIEAGYGYEYFHDRPNHFFSRIKPVSQSDYAHWHSLTRLGKIAWMWKVTYQRIFEELKTIPANKVRVVQLETLQVETFQQLAAAINISEKLDATRFNTIVNSRPGKGDEAAVSWSDVSRQEFNDAIAAVIPLMPPHIDSTNWLFL